MITDTQGESIEFVGVARIDSFEDIDDAANEACEKLKLDWKENWRKNR
jgi:diphthamide synthase subunit DPH2